MAEPASIFDPEDGTAKERAIAAAEALPEADDVSLDDVRRWLQSWGKPDELPPPPWK
ncbi:MAG: CopG family transcriptional regulator [Telmatospirillum sp.]|nr:CopG family transcriptional regulator [Telmatospirillum sp.]